MTDLTASLSGLWFRRDRIDWAWVASPAILLIVALLAPAEVYGIAGRAAGALAGTAPYIAFAIAATAYLRAASAEGVVAKAFTGDPARMVVLAALVGGLSPFCSCEVIPFIAALLAMGVPLSAVMAFWLASPLMDPPMFAITSGAIGLDFAIAKTMAAVGVGLLGGFGVMALSGTPIFADPLRPGGLAARRAASAAPERTEASCCGAPAPKVETSCCGAAPAVDSGCCGDDTAPKVESSCCAPESANPFAMKPVWAFWREPNRRAEFRETAVENFLFLGKWLLLAYVIEAVMIRWIPADMIASVLGGDGIGTIFLAALVGAPAYLNGYAAAPLAAGLIEQGMNPGAAMSFMLAGGVTCIPAAVAVWSLVRARIFAGYIAFATLGSVIAGLSFAAWSAG